jgi:hypothetical protein
MTGIVFLVGSFHPNFSAVGYCAYQVQKCLVDTFDVSTIAFRDDPSQPLDGQLDAIRVHRIETSEMRARGLARAAKGQMARARHALRLKGALRRLLSPETIDRRLVDAYLERLKGMDPQPDVIVPVVFPFETVLAALAYKRTHPGVMVVPYLFDDFVDSGSLHVLKLAREMKRPRHLHLERRMLAESDAVLAMHPLRRHLEGSFDSTLLAKVMFLEHPLLSPPARATDRCDDGIIRLCFTGSLIQKVREPGYLINLLGALKIDRPVRADFFVMGNVAREVPSGVLGNGLEIVNHGRVPKPEADAAVARADILINIGEVTGRQISSKVFEYMATGKPIIHLAHVENDAVTKVLSKYPLTLSLIEDRSQLDENAHKVSDFIGRGAAEKLTFEQVKTIYPEALPATTANFLKDILKTYCANFETETEK